MADCSNIIGVKNISITFRDCDTGQVYGPIIHDLAGETLPTWDLCADIYTPMTGGYVSKAPGNNTVNIEVLRDYRVPLALYQGCASLDMQVEYESGMVITTRNITPTGDNPSDTHTVTIDGVFESYDELLPAETLDANAEAA